MSVGANAFTPPMFVASSEDEPSRLRKLMPFIVLAGVAVGSALAVWIVMLVNQPASKDDAEMKPSEEVAAAQVEAPEVEGPPAEAKVMPALPNPAAPPAEEKPAAEAPVPAPQANAAAAKPEASEEDADENDGRSTAERDAARERRHAARAAKAAAAAPAAPASNKPAAPSRADIIAAMSRVQPAVVRCMAGTNGVITADMKILNTGRVASVNISGAPGPAGSCIAGAVRKAQFPPFTTPSIAVRYPMKLQ